MVFWAKTKTLLTTQRNSTGKQLKPLSWKDNHSFKPCPKIRPRRRNLKRSFISTFRPTVHTNPSRKRCFSKTLFKPKEFERRLYVLDGKQFENDSFTIIIWFLCPTFSQTEKSFMTDESGVFKFHGLSVDGKHLMRFQNEQAVFIFLLRLKCGRCLTTKSPWDVQARH